MLAQGRQHIGSIGEGQVAVRASVPCASFAPANFATKTSAKPPEVVSKVPAMVGKSPNPVPPVTISRGDLQNRCARSRAYGHGIGHWALPLARVSRAARHTDRRRVSLRAKRCVKSRRRPRTRVRQATHHRAAQGDRGSRGQGRNGALRDRGLVRRRRRPSRAADIDWLLRWAKAQQFNSACGSGTTASPRHVPRVGGLTRSCSFSADLVSRSSRSISRRYGATRPR
jgi:hypothetical protein